MTDIGIVRQFWHAIDQQDWESLSSCLAENFTRIGMSGEEADTFRGRDSYVSFASEAISKIGEYQHEVIDLFYAPDGRSACAKTRETIVNIGQDPVVFDLLNLFKIDEYSKIVSLSLYWKTPTKIPDSWRAVDGVLLSDAS